MFNSKDNNLLYEAYASVYNSAEYLEESQHARENPDEYERSSEAREGRRRRSGINDPKTGINSPAFAAFMAQQMGGKKKKKEVKEDVYRIILSYLLDEGYADNAHSAVAIMGNMSEEWRESIVEEVISEGEKPFPDEKVKAKQVALRDKGSASLERRMKMGLARRRAKEAEKTGGSQQDAGKGWYHGR
jgi:hypothetical protein